MENIKLAEELNFLHNQSDLLRGSWQGSLFPQGAVAIARSMHLIRRTGITG
jgi:hypothetical protein